VLFKKILRLRKRNPFIRIFITQLPSIH